MFNAFSLFLRTHPYIAIFLVSFLVGFFVSFVCLSWNREKKKHGFRDGRYLGKDHSVDKDMKRKYREYKYGHMGADPLEDDMEQHASKKF